MANLTHYGRAGKVKMVDITAKPASERTAVAHAFVRIRPAALRAIRGLRTPKGSPLEVARIAGILAAKRTAELIPLCHPLPITHTDLSADLRPRGVEITSRVVTTASTGVEMEALVAAAVAALTVYDMAKALDRGMEITELHLVEKRGGKSGLYRRRPKDGKAKHGR
ncbi:MAG TPA: cyclic pyranopterin monophosphate synthase MoaC [Patescibacteria group bacterium]|nr:cyclic pyranopterin monophosphate synthase MoaC [Patescibacteria group bacterium]